MARALDTRGRSGRLSLPHHGNAAGYNRTVPTQPTDPRAALSVIVDRARARARRLDDAVARTRALGEVIAALQEQVDEVASDRDAALVELLAAGRSRRSLAREFGLSHQRVAQLAILAGQGRPAVRQRT